jgi:geranylgeranyl diphosphate synthase type II
MAEIDIGTYLKEKKSLVEEALNSYLGDVNPLFPIMRYSLQKGKRIRPILAITTFECCGGSNIDYIMPVACGLELIHTYSLIHDDLPSMDNDDLRRGKPSAHKKFGEATAILSGDGLFAFAFELFSMGNGLVAEKNAVVNTVSDAVGPKGVVYGQKLDIDEHQKPDPRILRRIHLNKTAKFIAASIKSGAIMAQVDHTLAEKLFSCGLHMGMLFQYTDDILDVVGKKEKLGKTPGKDEAAGKITAPRVYGVEGARFRAGRYASRAQEGFQELGDAFALLGAITEFILNRTF